MINFDNVILTDCIVHKVGNRYLDETLIISKDEIQITEELELQLINYFLKPFKAVTDTFCFRHDIDLKMNSVFLSADNLFEEQSLLKNSANIAKHLFQQTRHANIKSGELFVAIFDEIVFEGVICKGVGIFKSERKDSFLKVKERDKEFKVTIENGISISKLDKGCLILNDGYHEGFRVFTFEHNNADTEYWRNDFLSIHSRDDSNFQTKNFLNVCRDFVKERFSEEFEVTKAEQINLLNKSVEYFKKNTEFKVNDFVTEVFEDEEVIKSFKKFKTEYQREEGINIDNSFNISNGVVKKQSKAFKSVLKLDKNFHVYIHGNRDLIEQGIEKDGRKYYKIYFENEL